MQVEAKRNINKSKVEVLTEIRKSGNLENYHPKLFDDFSPHFDQF